MSSAIIGLISAVVVALISQIGSAIREKRSNKNEKEDRILSDLKDLKTKVDEIERSFYDYQAKAARNRILRFESEIRSKQKHTYEMWTQIIDDIADYESYCKAHPDFKNGRGRKAMDHISKVYSTLEDNDEFMED